MKLTNNIIFALVQAGCLNLTANNLNNASQAYKVIKFRKEVSKAFGALQEAEISIVKDCNLEIGKKGVLNGKDEDLKKCSELRAELYKDEVELDIKTIPYADWHELKKENKGLGSAYIEDNLEGVLWVKPEEE